MDNSERSITSSDGSPESLISVRGLKVHYSLRGRLFSRPRAVKAVDGVDIEIHRGETLGLVGESGCGKSTLGRSILSLTDPTAGEILYKGHDLARLTRSEMRKHRRHLQMVFQDPSGSLDPLMPAGKAIAEPLRAFGLSSGAAEKRAEELMEAVGLNPRLSGRLPKEFSGGQRQRIGIARALSVDPEFIVADEPISALDVSIQAQIMNLLRRLQVEKGLTYLFISHDLRAVRHLSDRTAVMYLGRVVELAASEEVYTDPLMPYTQALISAVPVPVPDAESGPGSIVLGGDVPSPIDPPTGCPFHTRCVFAISECKVARPSLVDIKPRHQAACIRINPDHPNITENALVGLGAIGK